MTKIPSIGKEYVVRDYLTSDEYADITTQMFELTKSMFGKVDKAKLKGLDISDPLKALDDLDMGIEDIDQSAMMKIYDNVCCSICDPPLDSLGSLPNITDAKIHKHVLDLYEKERDEINALMTQKG